MKVNLPEKAVSNAEYVFTRERFKTSYGVVSHQNAVKQAVKVEWYTDLSRVATVVYCNIWVGDACSGAGHAGGRGHIAFAAGSQPHGRATHDGRDADADNTQPQPKPPPAHPRQLFHHPAVRHADQAPDS